MIRTLPCRPIPHQHLQIQSVDHSGLDAAGSHPFLGCGSHSGRVWHLELQLQWSNAALQDVTALASMLATTKCLHNGHAPSAATMRSGLLRMADRSSPPAGCRRPPPPPAAQPAACAAHPGTTARLQSKKPASIGLRQWKSVFPTQPAACAGCPGTMALLRRTGIAEHSAHRHQSTAPDAMCRSSANSLQTTAKFLPCLPSSQKHSCGPVIPGVVIYEWHCRTCVWIIVGSEDDDERRWEEQQPRCCRREFLYCARARVPRCRRLREDACGQVPESADEHHLSQEKPFRYSATTCGAAEQDAAGFACSMQCDLVAANCCGQCISC
jgi:hypothetical protein